MNDRELLELAAKAAGIELHRWMGDLQNRYLLSPDYESGLAVTWNPLTDDGDALRLAVSLHLLVDTDNCCAMHISKSGKNPDDWADGELLDDHLAATRRAIVRAAAAIGEAMQ